MNFRTPLVTLALSLVVLPVQTFAGIESSGPAGDRMEEHQPSLQHFLRDRDDTRVLAALLQRTGLAEVLESSSALTILAPNDAAFAAFGIEASNLDSISDFSAVASVLKLHVIDRSLTAIEAASAGRATSVGSQDLEFSFRSGRLEVELLGGTGAVIVDNDLPIRNGVVHVIDTVLVKDLSTSAQRQEAAIDLLTRGVRIGAPAFNDGDPALCCEIYELTLIGVRGLLGDGLSPELDAQLASALVGEGSTERARARRLRRVIEACYSELRPQPQPVARRASKPSSKEPLIDALREARRRGHG
ncbi:MAG: fasciclin domain-containing protein [Planctomycetota bacterium]